MHDLGRMHEQGMGQPANIGKALEWYEKSAEKGGTLSMSRLGVIYAQGRLVTRDYAKAKAWFEKSANAGSGEGMVQLGLIYERGLGVPRQIDRARELYVKAVNLGVPRAVDRLSQVTTTEALAAGRYDEAFKRMRGIAADVERAEVRKIRKSGALTSRALTNLAWTAVLAHDFKTTLASAERALELSPNSLVALANKAHALLFLDRVDEARQMYLKHKGRPGPVLNGLTWDRLIATDFVAMRRSGLNLPAMTQIETELGVVKPQ
jgi:tetratricopeptide (TPR) repeat protein